MEKSRILPDLQHASIVLDLLNKQRHSDTTFTGKVPKKLAKMRFGRKNLNFRKYLHFCTWPKIFTWPQI